MPAPVVAYPAKADKLSALNHLLLDCLSFSAHLETKPRLAFAFQSIHDIGGQTDRVNVTLFTTRHYDSPTLHND